MSTAESTPSALVPLAGGYRVVRSLRPPESPFTGALARTADAHNVVLVRSDELTDWPGWIHGADGHVLGVRDLVLTSDGTGAELEWCVEPADAYLRRRQARSDPLSEGEAVTLAVSVLRGVHELASTRRRRADPLAAGAWWLTDLGKPVFVHGDLGEAADLSGRELLDEAARQCGGRVGEVIALVGEDLGTPRDQDAEDRLFGLTTPLRLAQQPSSAESAVPASARPRSEARLDPDDDADRGIHGWVRRHIDMGIVGQAGSLLRRRSPHRARRRRGPVIVATTLAAGAVIVGLTWPTGSAPPVRAEPPRPTQTPPLATASPQPATDATDLAAITEALLAGAKECASEDAPCLAAYLEDPGAPPPGDMPSPEQHAVGVLDEFGDVAVLHVPPETPGSPSYRVVIARGDDGWRIRTVYGVDEVD